MFLVPAFPEIGEFFDLAGFFDFYAYYQAAVEVETARGRALGSVEVSLVDCPWAALQFFKRSSALRGEAAASLLKFVHEGITSCCSRDRAYFTADAWILENIEEEAAGDYVTCEEAEEAERVAVETDGLGQLSQWSSSRRTFKLWRCS